LLVSCWCGSSSLRTAWAENPLRDTTEKLRRGRPADLPLEVYLRHLVKEDPAFGADSSLAGERLSPPMRSTYAGLRPLLSATLQMQFLGLSSDSLREEWLRRYWKFRDPTPTTPENERQAEHQSRVREARDRFAWKAEPGWDDRGAIWIQYGAPDSIFEETPSVEEGLGFVPGHALWMYFTEKWVVEFERPNPKGAWKLGRSSARLSYRPDLVARDRERLGYDPSKENPVPSTYDRASDIIGFAEDRLLVNQDPMAYETASADQLRHEIRTDLRAHELLRKKEEALVRFREQYEKGGNDRFTLPGSAPSPLWYVFDVDAFKGPPGRMRVEVHYQVSLQDLQFTWADSLYLARYRAEGVLLDSAAHETARDEYTETIKADAFRSTFAAQLLPGQLVFLVPEGTYRLSLRVVDLIARSEGTFVSAVEIPRFDGRALQVSDVQMATSIVYAGDDWRSRFVKNDRLVIPNPLKAYTRDRQLVGYYEIYGLTLGPQRTCRYEVKYTIAPRSLGRDEGLFPRPGTYEKPYVSASFADEGGTPELVQELRVDIGALAPDTYDLVLTVRDLTTGTEASSRTAFAIIE
jgi:GWxTD domain-containing protein